MPASQASRLAPAREESLSHAQFAAHLGFVLTGVVNTLLGPILPIVSQRWSLTDAQAGRLFAAQFFGAMLGTFASGRLMAVLGVRRCAMLGLAMMAAGVAATGLADHRFGALAVIVFGLGLGVGVPATNLWIARADPSRSASALSLLNASWCIGAASCAPLILYGAGRIGLTDTLAIVAVLLAATAIIGTLAGRAGARRAARHHEHSESSSAANSAAMNRALTTGTAKSAADAATNPAPATSAAAGTHTAPIESAAAFTAPPASPQPLSPAPVEHFPRIAPQAHADFIALISALLFFYVGVETGVGGWAATYAQRLHLFSAAKIGFAQSVFYGALLIGRVLAPLALRRVSALRLLFAGMAVGAAGSLLFTIAPQPAQVLAGICIAGIGMAPMFPVAVSIYSDELGAATTRSAGLVFAIANVGGITFPWLIGEVSTRAQGLRYGMLVPFACIAAMLVIATRLKGLLRKI